MQSSVAELPASGAHAHTLAPAKKRAWLLDLLGLGTVAALVAKLYYGYDHVRDIGLDDETVYLASGVRMFVPEWPNCANGLPAADTGPIYSLWYFALSHLFHDRVTLYYANQALLNLLLAGAFFVLLRVLRVRASWAVALTTLLLTSRLLDQWPYPTYFAGIVMVAGAIAAARASSQRTAARALLMAFGVAAFVRPEMCVAFLLLAALLAALLGHALWRRRIGPLEAARHGAIAMAPFAILSAIFGSPLGGERSFYAFGQHYALNKVEEGHLPINPWTNWTLFTHADFGDAHTVTQAARLNPQAFVHHLLLNVSEIPSSLGHVLQPLLAMPKPVTFVIELALIVFLLAGAIALVKHARRRGADLGPLGIAALAPVVVAVMTLAVSTLIHPRFHYFVPGVALGAAFCAAGVRFARERAAPAAREARWTLAVCLAAVVLAPNRAYGWTLQSTVEGPRAETASLDRLRTIRELRALRGPDRVVVLEPAWGFSFLAGLQFDRVAPWEKQEPLRGLLEHRHIGIIVLTDELRADSRFSGDPELAELEKNPASFGFRMIDVPHTTARIAIRETGGAQTSAK